MIASRRRRQDLGAGRRHPQRRLEAGRRDRRHPAQRRNDPGRRARAGHDDVLLDLRRRRPDLERLQAARLSRPLSLSSADADGDILLLAHRLPQTSLHYSLDEGKTWSENVPVDDCIGAYPSMVELKDGSVLIVYYEEGAGSNIRARRFRLAQGGIDWLSFAAGPRPSREPIAGRRRPRLAGISSRRPALPRGERLADSRTKERRHARSRKPAPDGRRRRARHGPCALRSRAI